MQPPTEPATALFCAGCGTPLPDDSRFCHRCGRAALRADEQPAAPPPARPAPVPPRAAVPEPVAAPASPVLTLTQPPPPPPPPPAPPAPPASPRPGAPPGLAEQLQSELGGEIVVGREAARGPFIVTYLGVTAPHGRSVEIHVVPPEIAIGEPARTQRLLAAARGAAKLRHPRIAPVYRVAAGDRLCWYVVRHESGTSLEQALEQEWQFPVARAVDMISEIGAALSYAHEQKVVHGDLTPERVVLDERGAVSVRDFGLERAAQLDDGRPGAAVRASAYYNAPETTSGGVVSGAADQYSLAVMAYQVLAGNLPFIGATADEVVRQHRVASIPSIAVSRPDLPSALPAVLERALSKRPGERYQSVARFTGALRASMRSAANAAASVPARTSADSLLLGLQADAAPPLPAQPESLHLGRMSRQAGYGPRPGHTFQTALRIGGLAALALLAYCPSRNSIDPAPSAQIAAVPARRPVRPAAPAPPPDLATDSLAGQAAGEDSLASSSATPDEPASAPAPPPPPPPAPRAAPPRAASRPAANRPANRPPATPPSNRQTAARPAPTRPAAAARQRDPEVVSAPPADAPDRGTAWVTVGTNPQATIYINDDAVPSNPVRNYPVPAGVVWLRFQVVDSAANSWRRDTVLTVKAGDTLNLRRLRLTRP